MNFINKILVSLSCIIVIIIIVTFYVKKEKNSKKSDNTPHHSTFLANDLDLSNMFGNNDLDLEDIITPGSAEIFEEQKIPIMQSKRNSRDYEKSGRHN